MLSQGSATQADGPPHGNASSYPTMTDRRETKMGGSREVWKFSLEERKEDSRAEQPEETRGEEGNIKQRRHTCKTGHG